MNYNQLSTEHKVAFYNDLCEEPFAGDPNTIVPATTGLLKASGWSIDEINDQFKTFVDEKGLGDGQPSKCTVELGLESPPPQAPAAPTPTPPKKGRKKAAAPTTSAASPTPPSQPQANGDATVQTADAGQPAPASKKRGNPGNLVPREPRIKEDQMLYPGLKPVSGIRLQFRNLIGDGCTLKTLIERYDAMGVSTEAKNRDGAGFVRGYINKGLREDIDLCRLSPVTAEEKAAFNAAQAAAAAQAPTQAPVQHV